MGEEWTTLRKKEQRQSGSCLELGRKRVLALVKLQAAGLQWRQQKWAQRDLVGKTLHKASELRAQR